MRKNGRPSGSGSTSSVSAYDLNGNLLWRWGDFSAGRRGWHHDVACQIYDWDGDGANEVILCTDGFLVELGGATGKERRRLPIPKEATDCLVFANLTGGPRATDVLIKDRYTQIHAMDKDGKALWTARQPGGYRTAHQPYTVDIDRDGRDEIMAGFCMLNPDGQIRWALSNAPKLAAGHLDYGSPVRHICGMPARGRRSR